MAGLLAAASIAACSTTPDLTYGVEQDAGQSDSSAPRGEGGETADTSLPGEDAAKDAVSAPDADASTDSGVTDATGQDVRDASAPDGDANTCNLPIGATVCCGLVPCVVSGGQCTNKCSNCETTCATQVCCAKGPQPTDITCKMNPSGC
jgi:hypothetical protein